MDDLIIDDDGDLLEQMATGAQSKITKMDSKKKSSNKSFKEERSPAEQAMFDKVDENDKAYQTKVDDITKESQKTSGFTKLMRYNDPKIFILLGIFVSLLVGGTMPALGVFLSKVMGWLTAPVSYLKYMEPDFVGTDAENLEYHVNYFALVMFGVALTSAIAKWAQINIFGYLSEGVTYRIRTELYTAILQKNIGWFDDRQNGASVLTSAMAEDTTIINGCCSDAIAP